MKPELLKGHLDLLLMAVLENGPLHGYAIIEALRLRSGGTFALPEGTVYPALHRLEAAGLLVSHWDVVEGRRRRVYELSGGGRESLRAQRQTWETFSAGIQAVLGGAA
jgi:DNA-binding PadR family transcriptional regulator